jgi:hypothetical protein
MIGMNNIDSILSAKDFNYMRSGAAPQTPGADPGKNSGGEENALTIKEKLDVKLLGLMDRSVRAHESGHLRVAMDIAVGVPAFEYKLGPDGKKYAVGGEVQIDASVNAGGDPEAAIEKALKIKSAALAPSDPSPKDLRTAAQAQVLINKARRMLDRERLEEIRNKGENPASPEVHPGMNAYKNSGNADYQKNLSQILDLFF